MILPLRYASQQEIIDKDQVEGVRVADIDDKYIKFL